MNVKRWIGATAALLVAAFAMTSLPAVAHHASGPFYDSSKRVEMQGAVTRFVFKNPHATLYVDAADDKGQTIHWQIELGAPASLVRTGWTPDTLKAGVMIKVSGQPSRAEGTYGMCCARITKLDGSPIVSGGRVQEEVQPPR